MLNNKFFIKLFPIKKPYNELETELTNTKVELVHVKELLTKALEQIFLLQKEVSDLKNQLNKNSNNSFKSPSTDHKSNTHEKNKKQRIGKKGSNRPLFSKEQINKTIECSSDKCPCCGSNHIEDLSIF